MRQLLPIAGILVLAAALVARGQAPPPSPTTDTVSREEYDKLKREQDEMRKEIDDLKRALSQRPAPEAPAAPAAPAVPSPGAPATAAAPIAKAPEGPTNED